MQQLNANQLRKSVTFYVAFTMIVFMLFAILAAAFMQHNREKHDENEYRQKIDTTITYVVTDYFRDYSYRLRGIVETTSIQKMVQEKNREALLHFLEPKWLLMREEEEHLEVMQVHLADGTSLLRMHEPHLFGDELSSVRPMIKEIHTHHKPLQGYETGRHQNVYRIIEPLFDSDAKYIGAIEIGLNPNFILRAVNKINGFEGMMFIEEESLKLNPVASDVTVEKYTLQSKLTPELKKIAKVLEAQNHLSNTTQIRVEDKEYLIHLVVLKDFRDVPKVKIVFFQETSTTTARRGFVLFFVLLGMVLGFWLLVVLIYRRIGSYQERVNAMYHEQLEKINETTKQIQELSQRFQYAVSGTGDGLWDWNLLSNELYLSPSLKRQLGYKDEELENSFDTWRSRVHPEDVEQAIYDFEANINGKTQLYENVHRLRHKDGHWVWILDRGQTIFDANAKAVRMVGFHTDISEQKEFEELLRNAKLEFDLFMKYIPASILIKDEAGKIVYANKSANAFFNQENIIGATAFDLLPQDVAVLTKAFDEEVLQKGKHEDIKEFYNAKGSLEIVRTLGFKIQMQDAHVHIGLVMLNITQSYLDKKELKNKEDIMIAQSRHAAMGEMISMIAHQWRQPISVIAMDANNILVDIELEMLEEATLKENSLDIIRQTQELSKTIDDFRNFFKPQANAVSVSLQEVLTNAFSVIHKSLENNNIVVETHIQSTAEIVTFSRELMQVFINIIKNAHEALMEKEILEKKISITIEDTIEGVRISICDNAGGVDDAIVESIFNPYFSTKGEKNGTGLGLYMSKTIVENHLGGTLGVKNRNGGACFEISLPQILPYRKDRGESA